MKKERWVVSAKRADFQAIADRFGIDPVIARLIRNRDVTGEKEIEEYLFGDLEQLHDPLLMKDMERAADLIAEKIREKKPIRIIGDYDIDGVTATYILLTGLKDLGADADVRIPDRIADGYGLNEHLVQFAADEGRDTIVTCDNGIAAGSQIRLAKELGISMEETMAVGDSGNDAEMLKAAGLGVAMENASKEIKDISDVVTLTNEECGVAHAIETYILNAE